ECQYTSVDARFDTACRALVAASLSRHLDDPQSATIRDEVRQLLDWGAQQTPEAIAAAGEKYVELKNRQPRDPRIDVAFAIALNNQRQFRKALHVASICLRSHPGDIGAQKARIWAELSLQKIEDALAHLPVLADQFRPTTGNVADDDDFPAAARFLGAA